jgi:hypothetical protein
MATYLRHTPTGDMYIFTSALAKRKDMELVEEDSETTTEPEKTAAAPKSNKGGRGGKKNTKQEPAEPANDETEEPPVDDLKDLELDLPLADETGE